MVLRRLPPRALSRARRRLHGPGQSGDSPLPGDRVQQQQSAGRRRGRRRLLLLRYVGLAKDDGQTARAHLHAQRRLRRRARAEAVRIPPDDVRRREVLPPRRGDREHLVHRRRRPRHRRGPGAARVRAATRSRAVLSRGPEPVPDRAGLVERHGHRAPSSVRSAHLADGRPADALRSARPEPVVPTRRPELRARRPPLPRMVVERRAGLLHRLRQGRVRMQHRRPQATPGVEGPVMPHPLRRDRQVLVRR